jgi:phosphoribosylformylglycinamidine synthase
MPLLGWVPYYNLPDDQKPRFVKNTSERFESRFVTVTIFESPSIMLDGMAGSRLGTWVAHGEGRLHLPDPTMLDEIDSQDLALIRYVDNSGQITETYPFNPNGSPRGVAALCTPNGRHLAMMPHPERTIQLWHWPWLPTEWYTLKASPWLKMFQNAYDWCKQIP